MRYATHFIFLFTAFWFYGCYGSVILDTEWVRQPLGSLSQKPNLKWEEKFNEPFKDVFPINDSMALVFTHRSTAFILNSLSGKQEGSKWHPNLRKFSNVKIHPTENGFVFTSRKGELVGFYDLYLGKQRWKRTEKGLIGSGLAIMNDSQVVIATRNKVKFLSVDSGDLITEWKYRQGILSLQHDGKFLFVIQDNGILQALEIDKLIWEADLGLTHESKIVNAWDSRLGVVNNESLVFLNKGNGQIIDEINWEPIADVFLMPDQDNFILVSKNGNMVSISQTTGEKTEFDLPDYSLVKHAPIYSRNLCIIPFADGTLTGINIKNGSLEWQIETGKPITGFWRLGKGFMTQDVKKMLRYYQ